VTAPPTPPGSPGPCEPTGSAGLSGPTGSPGHPGSADRGEAAVPGESGEPTSPADSAGSAGATARPTRSPRAQVVRDALGVGVAVGLSGFAFGVTSAGAGLALAQTCALSLLVFTGASQFALVSAVGAGGSPFAAAAGAFFLGTRNAFYGLRLSQLLRLPAAVRPLAAQWVIDETSAVALAQKDRASARLGFTVTGISLYALWNLTTLGGALGASALGDPASWGLDAAGPAVFLALLAPMVKGRTERSVAALAVLLGLGCLPLLPAGVPVLIAALAAPLVLAATRAKRAGKDSPGPVRQPARRDGKAAE
jgi:predicted branched-subunit amino acid permease